MVGQVGVKLYRTDYGDVPAKIVFARARLGDDFNAVATEIARRHWEAGKPIRWDDERERV